MSAEVRAIDGTGNNPLHSTWGSAGVDLLRVSQPGYGDGISSPAGANRPSARLISNTLSTQTADLTNGRHLSDFVYLFGQFIDHDIDLTPGGSTEPLNVAVPTGDAYFDPNSTGTQSIGFTRSVYDPTTGTSTQNPRQQPNVITSFLDGSMVYGSDSVRAAALRTFVGGRMKTSAGDLLPLNTLGLANANDAHIVADNKLFLAGDVRANENIELTAIQTLFVREHNLQAARIAAEHPGLTDEQIYQQARAIVGAEIQSITYNEFLPALLGKPLKPYAGYNPNVNPGVTTEFSTAAYRFGHSMLDGGISRLDNQGNVIPEGNLQLQQAFFNPTLLDTTLPNHEGDIGPILKGAASGDAQEIDLKIVDDVRNFLFGPPGAGGFDLASLNIQRGRDHGLADYNSTRVAFGLPAVTSFSQITSDPVLQQKLATLYGDVNNVDLWVGGLAEDHAPVQVSARFSARSSPISSSACATVTASSSSGNSPASSSTIWNIHAYPTSSGATRPRPTCRTTSSFTRPRSAAGWLKTPITTARWSSGTQGLAGGRCSFRTPAAIRWPRQPPMRWVSSTSRTLTLEPIASVKSLRPAGRR